MHSTNRSLSYPLSSAEASVVNRSPFTVSSTDAERLFACESFQIVRKHLAKEQSHYFCAEHRPASREDEDAWLLHRDITHALILPLLQIYRRASDIAEVRLSPSHAIDRETAYRGPARDAFSWLQCFVIEEKDWCSTKGCPACVVTNVLQSETTIRMIIVACRLSEHLRHENGVDSLPKFTFWLRSLRVAMDNDSFWGPGDWEEIESKASTLKEGMEELMRQCRELELVCPTKSSRSRPVKSPLASTNMPSLKVSSAAVQQLLLQREYEEWRRSMALTYWASQLADSKHQSHFIKTGGLKTACTRLLQPRLRAMTT